VRRLLFALSLLLTAAVLRGDDTDRIRELEAKVKELQGRVAALEALGPEGQTKEALAEIHRQIDVLTREIENLKTAAPEIAAPRRSAGASGLGPAAAKVYASSRGVSIGGYGEALYQNFAGKRQDGAPSGLRDRIDLERAVLYFGYRFDEQFLLDTEIEYEHATTGAGAEQKGETSVEFAYLDWISSRGLGVRAGLLLLPLGFLNEMHEPPTFLGALRPETELLLLPTTWSELGLGVHGETGGFSYRVYLVNGLDSRGFSAAAPIRGGRQEGSEAIAENFAVTGRLDYVGVSGLLLGVSGFTGDSAQGAKVNGQGFGGRVSLFDAHAQWLWRGLRVRALYVGGSIGDAAQINAQNGFTGNASVPSRFVGGYVEAGFDVLAARAGPRSLLPFVRYERYNTQERVPQAFAADAGNDVSLWTLGVVFQPIPPIAVKADYQIDRDGAGTGVNRFNLAVGYLF
jgi:hypothetical protein